MSAGPVLSIVIPTHRRTDLLERCLQSVCRHAPADTEIVVVDDASPRHAATGVAQRFAGVRCVRRERASGFAAAANAGIRASRGAVVELLNDDTEVSAGWAEAALAHFQDRNIGAVAPLVLAWPDGKRIDSAGDRYYLGGIAAKRARGDAPGAAHQQPQLVFGASASSAFYRRAALEKVGLFPESFGSYFEDVDLAFRLQRAGFRAVFEPRARVLHHVGASHGVPNRHLLAQQSLNEERVFWRNLPSSALARALPRHFLVLLAKALRRWNEGAFWPFLWGRLRLLLEVPALLKHRKHLTRLGSGADFQCWQVEERYG